MGWRAQSSASLKARAAAWLVVCLAWIVCAPAFAQTATSSRFSASQVDQPSRLSAASAAPSRSETADLPNLVGRPESAALRYVSSNFNVKLTPVHSNRARGMIDSQHPGPGVWPIGTTVMLGVSDGIAPGSDASASTQSTTGYGGTKWGGRGGQGDGSPNGSDQTPPPKESPPDWAGPAAASAVALVASIFGKHRHPKEPAPPDNSTTTPYTPPATPQAPPPAQDPVAAPTDVAEASPPPPDEPPAAETPPETPPKPPPAAHADPPAQPPAKPAEAPPPPPAPQPAPAVHSTADVRPPAPPPPPPKPATPPSTPSNLVWLLAGIALGAGAAGGAAFALSKWLAHQAVAKLLSSLTCSIDPPMPARPPGLEQGRGRPLVITIRAEMAPQAAGAQLIQEHVRWPMRA
jgi:hypothetical protein